MVDKRIISLLKNSNLNNFRSVIVLIGDNSKYQIPTISNLLAKNSYKPVNSIIWCYKDPSITSCTDVNSCDEKMKDFYKSKDIQFLNYTETDKILGQTVDMLILQDFECLTPNLIALSVETVRGGGVIILLFDKNKTLDSIVNTRSELISCGEFVPRYNRRLFRSLINSHFTIFCDSSLHLLGNLQKDERKYERKDERKDLINNNNNKFVPVCGVDGVLLNLGKTEDQKYVLNELFKAVKDRTERGVYSIQAGRGRGKSVSLGLAISRAVDLKYSSIFVTSPALENVKMVFEFAVKGLEAIGYKKYVDFKIVYQFKGKKRLIQRIEFSRGFKQTIEYFNPFDELKYHPDMFIVDEAAAIPLPVLKRLLFPNLIIMATTVSGYEGTGRAFSTKLSEYLKEKYDEESKDTSYKELLMTKSIRYGDNDPVEKWLNKTLLLDVQVKPLTKCPIPSSCDLFYVSRDLLFSGSKLAEVILRDIFGLFIASHYKNSPNDIQILADSPNHEIFTLLTTVNDLPRVLCAVHVSFEGRCRGDLVKKGNLIPWIVSETYFDTEILESLGIRIVRIAVHPDYMSMGYGSRALDLLFKLINNNSNINSNNNNNNSITSVITPLIHKGDILFNELESIIIPKISWIGTSFGVTNKLLNFWKKHSLLPVCLKQKVSYVTGEHTLILMKATDGRLKDKIDQYYSNFKRRFIGQLAFSFRSLDPSLCLTLLFNKEFFNFNKEIIKLSQNDIERLEKYAKNTTDFYQVIDIIPLVSRMYFQDLFELRLTLLQQSILIMIGLQCQNIEEVAKFNSLNVFEVNSILMKIISNLLPHLEKNNL